MSFNKCRYMKTNNCSHNPGIHCTYEATSQILYTFLRCRIRKSIFRHPGSHVYCMTGNITLRRPLAHMRALWQERQFWDDPWLTYVCYVRTDNCSLVLYYRCCSGKQSEKVVCCVVLTVACTYLLLRPDTSDFSKRSISYIPVSGTISKLHFIFNICPHWKSMQDLGCKRRQ